ncbi:hypothetical protein BGX34_011543 [Mortierella sp. NVP85]|nr:hypothetical protein BGX34_011543 [Mortierella sp. NVP85]
MNGEIVIRADSNTDSARLIEPHCIKHRPGAALDVVISSSDENSSAATGRKKDSINAHTEKDEGEIIGGLQIAPLSTGTSSNGNGVGTRSKAYTLALASGFSDFKRGSRAPLSFKQIEKLAQMGPMESGIEQKLVSSLPSDIQVQVRSSTNKRESLIQVIKDGQVYRPNERLVACLQELDDKMIENNELASRVMDLVYMNNDLVSKNHEQSSKIIDLVSKNNEQSSKIVALISKSSELLVRTNKMQMILDSKQDEMRLLQMQALDWMALLQNRVRTLLAQTYELHEYSIPQLFIVLPADTTSWNPLDLFSNKFRLYFLCECGHHTKSTNSKIPHHIHLAKHEGCDINRPNEFFQQYGSYVLTILRMLKFGVSVTGIAVSALSQLIRVDTLDKATENLKSLTNTIEPGVDQAIDHIEMASADEGGVVTGFARQMRSHEALEDADLRQLESFLKHKDENRVLGNLYRTVTSEGHVKWVCIDHYRENYNKKMARTFRNTVEALGGSFDENIGRVEVTLLESEVCLWTQGSAGVGINSNDFKKLRDVLAISNVGVLELHLRQQDRPTRNILNRNQRYDPVLDIMAHRSIRSFTIRGPQDFAKRSSLLSRSDDFSNLRYLNISLDQLKGDILGVGYLITMASNLSSLVLGTGTLENSIGCALQVCDAIAEHRSYSINFKDWKLFIPPPPGDSNRLLAAHRTMEPLLKVYCDSASRRLNVRKLDEMAVDAFAKATRNGSGFEELLMSRYGRISDPFVNNISSIVARSRFHLIRIHTKEDERRVRLLGSIQWSHIRELNIHLKPGTFETSVMRVLVDGVMKVSGKVDLEKFRLVTDYSLSDDAPLSMPQGDLLHAFIASLSLECLALKVSLILEQILSLLRLTNVSRLKNLYLWTKGFDSVKVEAILDALRHASRLKILGLRYAGITKEQLEWMKEKGCLLVMTGGCLNNTWMALDKHEIQMVFWSAVTIQSEFT